MYGVQSSVDKNAIKGGTKSAFRMWQKWQVLFIRSAQKLQDFFGPFMSSTLEAQLQAIKGAVLHKIPFPIVEIDLLTTFKEWKQS